MPEIGPLRRDYPICPFSFQILARLLSQSGMKGAGFGLPAMHSPWVPCTGNQRGENFPLTFVLKWHF